MKRTVCRLVIHSFWVVMIVRSDLCGVSGPAVELPTFKRLVLVLSSITVFPLQISIRIGHIGHAGSTQRREA